MTYEQIKPSLPDNVLEWHYDKVKVSFTGLTEVKVEEDKILFCDKFGSGYLVPKDAIQDIAERLKESNR